MVADEERTQVGHRSGLKPISSDRVEESAAVSIGRSRYYIDKVNAILAVFQAMVDLCPVAA